MTKIEIAEELLLNSNQNLFITGKAGCLAGDTIIYVGSYTEGKVANTGKPMKLKRLYQRFHNPNFKKVRFTQSCENNLYICRNKITDVIYSGNKQVFEITTKKGNKIKATADHLFFRSNLTYSKVADLKVGDELVMYDREAKPDGRQKKQQTQQVCVRYHPTKKIKKIGKYIYYRVPKALMVLEANLNNLTFQEYKARLNNRDIKDLKFINLESKEIHHKDRNRHNNDLLNLEVLSIKDHHKEHYENARLNAKFKAYFDTIESIKFCSFEPTYDITMTKELPNFVANGFVVHNSGKSTLLKKFVDTVKDKNIAVLAPTGVAAVNVEGATIHSFFGLKPNITPEEIREEGLGREKILLKKLDLMIVDEISMVRADLLDCMDEKLRIAKKNRLPFGGIRFVFFGDLSQLPPIVSKQEQNTFKVRYKSPYFFEANSMSYIYDMGNMKVVELDKIFRQVDLKFIDVLNEIRENKLSGKNLDFLNENCFGKKPDQKTIFVCSTNAVANEINQNNLNKLQNKEVKYSATISGSFSQGSYPTEIELVLKKDSRVMFCKNDATKRFVNGTLGTILEVLKNSVIVKIDGGEMIEVTKTIWDTYGYESNGDILEKKVIGSFEQIPLKLAWAITIHKAQGKTFDNVVVDMGRGAFAHGQTYVALSRCRSLEGLILTKKLTQKDIIFDNRIYDFANYYQQNLFYDL
jgi:hypothetical protein